MSETAKRALVLLACIQGRGVQVVGVPERIRDDARAELERHGIDWRIPRPRPRMEPKE